MHIALIASPFIAVPPVAYGGTELFLAQLAEGLTARGHDVVVYANGASRVSCEVRACYPSDDWPPRPGVTGTLKSLDHIAWSVDEIRREGFDIVHLNDALAVPLSRFVSAATVHTLHHPHEPELTALYQRYPATAYVAISESQRAREMLPNIRTIHHGIRTDDYVFEDRKQPYACFLGRIAPMKGPHLAIAAARLAGMPLKLAGEIQPMFRGYWETEVEPYVDGRFIEYVGEADHALKNELLANASALLFPIQWAEPFGLVMIEAMACGTPVLALDNGSVREVVREGVSGRICGSVAELAAALQQPAVASASCRQHVERYFSMDRMVADYEALYAGLQHGAPAFALEGSPKAPDADGSSAGLRRSRYDRRRSSWRPAIRS